MHLKMSGKWRPFYLGQNVLSITNASLLSVGLPGTNLVKFESKYKKMIFEDIAFEMFTGKWQPLLLALEYFGWTISLPWLLISWWHKESWYWKHRINRSLPSVRKEISTVNHFTACEKIENAKNIFLYFMNKFSRTRVNNFNLLCHVWNSILHYLVTQRLATTSSRLLHSPILIAFGLS